MNPKQNFPGKTIERPSQPLKSQSSYIFKNQENPTNLMDYLDINLNGSFRGSLSKQSVHETTGLMRAKELNCHHDGKTVMDSPERNTTGQLHGNSTRFVETHRIPIARPRSFRYRCLR